MSTENQDDRGQELWATALELAVTADKWYDAGPGVHNAECIDEAKRQLAAYTDVDAKPWYKRFWAKLEGSQAPTKLGAYFAVATLGAILWAYIVYKEYTAPRPTWLEPSRWGIACFIALVTVALVFWLISVFNHWQARKDCQAHLKTVMAKHVKPTGAHVVLTYLTAHLEQKLPEDLFFAKQLMREREAAMKADQSLSRLSDSENLRIAMDSVQPVYLNSIHGQRLLLDMRAVQVQEAASDLMAKLRNAALVSEDDEIAEVEEHLSEAIKRLLPEINAVGTIVGLAVTIHKEGTCGKITRHMGWKILTKALEKRQIA